MIVIARFSQVWGSHARGALFLLSCVGRAIYIKFIKLGGWPKLEVCTFVSELSCLSLNPKPAINCRPGVSQAEQVISVCAIPRMAVKLGARPANISWRTLKIVTKSTQAISRTMNKLQICVLTYMEHCISGTAAPPANCATRSQVLHMKEDQVYHEERLTFASLKVCLVLA